MDSLPGQYGPWARMVAVAAITVSALGISASIPGARTVAHAQTAPTAPQWTPLGPVVPAQAGRVETIAVDPAGKIYAGGPGGVWISTDTGKTWTSATDQQASINIGWLAIDPNKMANPVDAKNPYPIYAGTGSGINGDVDGFPGEGVLKSVNGGASWTQLNPNGILTGAKTSQVAIDPHGSTLYVATDKGIFVSTNGGATFPTVLFQGQVVTALVLDSSTTPSTVFAAVKGVGIERSPDGTNFTVLGAGLPAANQFGNTALAIAPSNHHILYASVGQSGPPSVLTGVYKSVDGGTTWAQLPNIIDYTMYAGSTTGQSFANNVLAVKPDDPNTVYGAGVSLARSTDGGATWTNLSDNNLPTAFAGGDFHALTFDTKGNLYFGSDLGIIEQTADGKVQNLNGNLNTIMFYSGPSQFGNGSTILAGAQDNATWLYSGSPQWRAALNGDGFQTAIDPGNPNVMYGTNTNGIFETTDQWQTTQTNINPPNVPGGGGPWVKQMALSPNFATPDAPTVLYGVDKVYTSPDGGTTWTNGTNDYVLNGNSVGVSALAVAPSNPQVVYSGFSDGTLQVSKDQGASWTTLAPPSGAPNCNNCVGMWISHIAVDPTNPANVSVTFGAQAFPHTSEAPPHVVQGVNATTATPTWTEVTGNLPNDATDSVVYNGPSLIVATDKGVYSGTPAGANTNWVATAAGLPRVPVHDLLLTGHGTLIAMTFGRGAWQTTIPTISPNGTGTMTVDPALVKAGASGLTETFTYTAASGGLNNGEVDVSIPAGWTAPSTAAGPGNTIASTGALNVNGSTITVTGITLAVGATLTITYGQGGTATAPATNGFSTFVTRTQSGATPPLTTVLGQPKITTTTTGGTVPAAPLGVTTVPGDAGVCTDGSGAVSVSWTAPPFDGGSPVTSYHVVLNPGGLSLDSPAASGNSVSNICGLDRATGFTATVTATNANGTGPASAPSGAIMPAGKPQPPTHVTTIRGDGQVDVSWDPPANDNGAAVTSYTVTASSGGGSVTVPATDTSATIDGLTNGVPYTITVTANDEYGDSAPVGAPQSVTPSATPDVPNAPTDIMAHPGNGQATVSWTAPYDNGSPLVSYTVTADPGGQSVTIDASHTLAIVTGLTDGNAYTFTVTATNHIGDGPASEPSGGTLGGLDQSNGTVVGTAPGAPTDVRAVATNQRATVSWSEPQSTGGFEVGSYLVVASPGGQHVEVDGSVNSATLDGLQNGTPYTFKVTAATDFGEGSPSVSSSPVTPQGCTSINGSRVSVTLRSGKWCMSGHIQGSIAIAAGAAAWISNATITGGINGNGAASVSMCGSSVGGGTYLMKTSGYVLVGDTTDDDCAGNTLHSVFLMSNHGGVDLEDNTLTGIVVVNGTSGSGPAVDDTAPEISYNEITGLLRCTANLPAPTADFDPNFVTGARSGQCAGL